MATLLVGGEGHQSQMACPLDRLLHHPLVTSTGAGDATRQDLGAFEDELLHLLGVFVVNVVEMIRAELADLAPAKEDLLLHRSLGSRFPRTPSAPAAEGRHDHSSFA